MAKEAHEAVKHCETKYDVANEWSTPLSVKSINQPTGVLLPGVAPGSSSPRWNQARVGMMSRLQYLRAREGGREG